MNNANILLIGCCRSGHNFVKDQIEYWDTQNRYTIYPLDDFDPFTWQENKNMVAKNGEPIDLSKPTETIIVTRGLLNWWASYLMWITDKGTRPVKTMNLWNEMERWVAQVEYCEKQPMTMPGHHIVIQYEDFTTDPGERETVAGFLKLEWNDNRIHKRSVQGRGSSFEGWLDVGSREATQHRYEKIHPESVKRLFENTLRPIIYPKMLYRQNWNVPRHEIHYMDTGLIDN